MALTSTVSRSNWNLTMLVFAEGGKPEYPEKNPWSRDKNQQLNSTHIDAKTGNQTQATLVGGECSHLCTIPAPTGRFEFLQELLMVFEAINQRVVNEHFTQFPNTSKLA